MVYHDENAVALGLGHKKREATASLNNHIQSKTLIHKKTTDLPSNYVSTHITMQQKSERMYAAIWMMTAMMRSSSVSPR
jgi:hypothetical protein